MAATIEEKNLSKDQLHQIQSEREKSNRREYLQLDDESRVVEENKEVKRKERTRVEERVCGGGGRIKEEDGILGVMGLSALRREARSNYDKGNEEMQ